MATTRFELVTPNATLYSGQAEMVVCKSVEGEIAFLADHAPYIGALDPCVVRVVGPAGSDAATGGAEVRVAVRSGFVEVKDNQVIMLADLAVRPGDVDRAAAERDEQDAAQRVAASTDPDRTAEADLEWARARLELARGA